MSNSQQNLWPQTSYNRIPKLVSSSARQFEVLNSKSLVSTQSSITNIGSSDVIDLSSALKQITLQSKTILTMEEVAELLHCAVSTVQNIPIDELPASEGAGRYSLYLKSDVEEFVRKRKRVVKRGTGLGKRLNVIDHLPAAGVENPALEALKQL